MFLNTIYTVLSVALSLVGLVVSLYPGFTRKGVWVIAVFLFILCLGIGEGIGYYNNQVAVKNIANRIVMELQNEDFPMSYVQIQQKLVPINPLVFDDAIDHAVEEKKIEPKIKQIKGVDGFTYIFRSYSLPGSS